VRAEPARLNSAIAWLFMLGASCFAMGTIPVYVHAVVANAGAMTFYVGSGHAERECSPNSGVLDLRAFDSLPVLKVLGTDEASW
jgi:hypothetical protein